MAFTQTIPYTTSGNYTFDSDKVEVTGGNAQLKDQRPTNATFHANYTTDATGNWGTGTLTATLTNATVESGRLNLKDAGTAKEAKYVGTNKLNPLKGTIRLTYIPNYTGNPAANKRVFDIKETGTNNDRMYLTHLPTSGWGITVYNNSGGVTHNNAGLGSTTVTAGVSYELELNYDFTSGSEAIRLFVDGVQSGSTNTDASVRTDDITGIDEILFGHPSTATHTDHELDDIILFSSVQHTSNYTSGQSIPATVYVTDNPTAQTNATVTTDGLSAFTETSTKAGSDEIKYVIVQGGVDKYWTGTAWATSDGTYAQANTATEINTNAATLAFAIGATITIKAFLHSDDGSTRPQLDENTFDYDFFSSEPAAINETPIYFYVDDLSLDDVTAGTFTVSAPNSFFHGNRVFPKGIVETATVGSSGYVEVKIIETTSINQKLNFKLSYTDSESNTAVITFKPALIPDDPTNGIALNALTTVQKG